MYSQYFEGIKNVEVGPIISLILFVLFFIGVIIWIFRLDKDFIERMKNMPLDDDDPGLNTKI